jgi:hypothetical protein
MTKWIGILVLSSALLAVSSGAADAANDETFPTCDDAYNYGRNTSAFYVSAALNTANCESVRIEKAEAALAKSFKRQAIANRNSEEMQVCFYSGLYQGYIETLSAEYADCGLALGLSPSVARAAVAVFLAMDHNLDDVDAWDVSDVFDGVFPHDGSETAACGTYIDASTAGDLAGAAELADAVCSID